MDIDFKNQQINVQIHVVEIFVQSREGVWLWDLSPLPVNLYSSAIFILIMSSGLLWTNPMGAWFVQEYSQKFSLSSEFLFVFVEKESDVRG